MKKNYTSLVAIFFMLLAFESAAAQVLRVERQLKNNWKFTRTNSDYYSAAAFDDSAWQDVCVPHDWAISGPFDSSNDRQTVAIVQNGETEASEKNGRTGSLPWTGYGWYRTHFSVSPDAERVVLNFDGAMAEPEVYVNGQKVGEWKYGYNAFNLDITPYIIRTREESASGKGNRKLSAGKMSAVLPENFLAVRLHNRPESSRWYPGAGLYRPVTLIETKATAVDVWGVNFLTESVENGMARVKAEAKIVGTEGRKVNVSFAIALKKGGKTVRTDYSAACNLGSDGIARADIAIPDARLWSPENPNLYELTVRVQTLGADGRMHDVDLVRKNVGIRTISYTADRGFQLNGQTRKFRGVCLHHDLGMIGAAVNRAALTRQLLLLKTMGCDAIRTAHNMPSQMQMELCDSLGLMVMAESFDMWKYPKCKNGYALFFDEWWERDLTNLVLANRYHPSIVMWSIGNEIPEQGSKDGVRIVNEMQALIRSLDTTRPCTTGMDRVDNAVASGFADAIDIPGLNYRTQKYQMAHERLHHGFVLGSETASTVSSRGTYYLPVVRADLKYHPDAQCSGYDVEACSWSNLPEDDWVLQDDNDWVIGEFVWTGFDYLGEPTPYDGHPRARSSYFGIFDLAGLPKDRYYLYRSRWNSDAPTIHLLPHWTWTGHEGQTVPVYCYTNCPKAELFVNGKSQGVREKQTSLTAADKGADKLHLLDRYRLRWNDVVYEPGEIRVVAYDAEGKRVGESVVRTAGAPHHLQIEQQRLDEYRGPKNLRADGDDMAFYVVSLVDKDGNLCPEADQPITVDVTGAARFRGICNGDPTSFEVFTAPTMHLFKGQLAIGISSNGRKGKATITVSTPTLPSATATITAK